MAENLLTSNALVRDANSEKRYLHHRHSFSDGCSLWRMGFSRNSIL